MSSLSVQVKEPIASDGRLIGSFFSSSTALKASIHCMVCNEELLPKTKFCGECGSATIAQNRNNYSNPNLGSDFLNGQRAKVVGMPKFARLSPQMKQSIPPQLREEFCKVSCLLAREKLFLVMHYLLFITTNLFGLWCAFKAYTDLNADEMTRAVVALIPIICINAIAFACFVSIKGTKREVSRLKERMIYLHYQMEYANLS